MALGDAFGSHCFPIGGRRVGNRSAKEIAHWEGDVEVLVRIAVVQEVMPSHKLVGLPVGEEPSLRLVHFQMDLVPNGVVQDDDKRPDDGGDIKSCQATRPGDEAEYEAQRESLKQALRLVKADAAIFPGGKRVVVEVFAVLAVVLHRMAFENPLAGWQVPEKSESWLLVHQFAMYLMLN